MQKPTIADIHAAAERLAAAHREVTARAKAQELAISEAVSPIAERHRPGLEAAAEEKSRAYDDLMTLVERSPALFSRKRSLTVDGVRAGYRKQEDSLDWDEERQVIQRLRNLRPDLAPALIRTEESLVVAGLDALDGDLLRQLGIRRIAGADNAFVIIGDSNVDKLVKVILASVSPGDGAPKAKRGKAKIKEAA